jgi:hypothetical protein
MHAALGGGPAAGEDGGSGEDGGDGDADSSHLRFHQSGLVGRLRTRRILVTENGQTVTTLHYKRQLHMNRSVKADLD